MPHLDETKKNCLKINFVKFKFEKINKQTNKRKKERTSSFDVNTVKTRKKKKFSRNMKINKVKKKNKQSGMKSLRERIANGTKTLIEKSENRNKI